MHEIKKIFLILSLFILLSSCGVGKALAPQKKSGSDEFLVKKKIAFNNATKLWGTSNSF